MAVCRKVVHGVNHNSYYFSCLNLLVSAPAWERQSADPGESKMLTGSNGPTTKSRNTSSPSCVHSSSTNFVPFSLSGCLGGNPSDCLGDNDITLKFPQTRQCANWRGKGRG